MAYIRGTLSHTSKLQRTFAGRGVVPHCFDKSFLGQADLGNPLPKEQPAAGSLKSLARKGTSCSQGHIVPAMGFVLRNYLESDFYSDGLAVPFVYTL